MRRTTALARAARRRSRGVSIVMVTIILMVLVGFVSLAVDVGRVRLAKVDLQTAADASATSGASGLELAPTGMATAIDRAIDGAEANNSIDVNSAHTNREDHPVLLVPDEDIEFGIWRQKTQSFEKLESVGGGIDERREANAVRTWARRVTTFKDSDGSTIHRGTGLTLIFAPVLPDGPLKGEIQAGATALLRGGQQSGFAFVGFSSISVSGTVKTDSYDASNETYPGVGGANAKGTLASNGDIRLLALANIGGDVRPGIDANVMPTVLGAGVKVSGRMDPLEFTLDYPSTQFPAIAYKPPVVNDNALAPDVINKNGDQKDGGTIPSKPGGANYVISKWSAKKDKITIDNKLGPVNIYLPDGFAMSGKADFEISSNKYPVTMWCNGALDIRGGNLTSILPANLIFKVTRANSTVNLGGVGTFKCHVY